MNVGLEGASARFSKNGPPKSLARSRGSHLEQRPPGHQSGVSLIELVIAIVIIGIALTGVLLALDSTIATSADPMVEQQAVSIGEAYIEEIIGKSYAPQPNTGGRETFNDVDDYSNLPDNVVRDQNGNAIGSLSSYSIAVRVDDSAMLNGTSNAKLITVTVSHSGMQTVVLAAYRLAY